MTLGRDSVVSIGLLYPDLLGTYGDGGNAIVLQRRLAWRGIAAETVSIEAGSDVPESCHIYLLGGGEDAPQAEAARGLGPNGPVHRAVESGAVVLGVCAGLQIIGTAFVDHEGRKISGLGLIDCETIKTGEQRAVGELLVDPNPSTGLARLTGFENHGGRTRLGPGVRPLGSVTVGIGNGDGGEGVINEDRSRGNVVGTYMHGPVLARNPDLADLLLSWVLGVAPNDLAAVDDREAEMLRVERFQAVASGRLDGVAHRTWRDRLMGRN